MISLSGQVGFPCRAPETACRLRIIPAGPEPDDLKEAAELRERHERKRHRYQHGAPDAKRSASGIRVRKMRRSDLLGERAKCANPACTLDFPRDGKHQYCARCIELFKEHPERRPRGRLRCSVCGECFDVVVRSTPGRYSATCPSCQERLARVA